MDKPLPDKHIRDAVYDAVNNLVVDTLTIPAFDSRVRGNVIPQHFILMTTQTNQVNQMTKCGDVWESSILIDIVTTYNGSGNTGSRLLADNILDAVRNATKNLVLSASSGLVIQKQTQDFPNDIVTITSNENIFRKLMRLEFTIN
jgi:hypothetical protein|tara:strand:- start:45 stop:479 length:435 start_codon:yes stop_codon:yes gene_type:complete